MFAVLFVALLIAEGWGAQGPVGTADGFSPPATAEWEEGPVQDGIPRGDDARRLRVPVTVSLQDATATVRDLPVRMTLDVKEALDAGGWPMDSSGNPQGFSLDLDSIVVREVDEQGRPRSGERIPVQVFPGSFDDTRSFDPVAEPGVTLRWVLDGDMTGGDERQYFVYFDSDTRGERLRATYTKEDLAPLAAAAGPGRGTQVYIPFYALPQTRGELEERQVRIVNLAEGPNTVRVHEYTRFDRPQTNPAQTFTLDSQGDATTYVFGHDGLDRSQGRLLVDADAPVIAEVFKSRPASQFIPAMDGGFTGSRFLHNPDPEHFQGEMYLLCGASACKGSVVQGGTSQTVNIDSSESIERLDLSAGTPAELVLDEGHAALQTVTNVRSPVAWPSLTAPGPLERSLMMGHADPGDGLMILSETEEARLHLQRFGRNPLTEGHYLPRGHLQHLNIGSNPMGAAWDSAPWQNDLSEPGIVRAQEQNGAGGLHVISGTTGSGTSGRLSALVTPETSDGGLTYSIHVPGTSDTTFGNLVLFSPYQDTTVEAQRRTYAGVSRESLGPLSRHETATFDQPGSYTIQADRPVLVAWLRHHADFRMGGWGLGVTELAEASTGAAQFTGPVFDMDPERSVVTGRPGQLVEFQVEVTNLGRTVDGGGISDTARLEVQVPSGWRSAQVVPSTVPLDPEASETVTVQAQVPPEIDPSDGGASLRLIAHSETDSTYEARTTLRVNYEFHRDVEVSIDGMPVESRREILPDENATYLIRVTNQGSLNDTFQLEVSNATSAWETVFSQIDPSPDPPQSEVGIRPTHTPELAPGESVEYALDVRMAVERASRLITQLQATSESDRSVRDTARAVTAFAAERSFRIIVEDPVRLTPPGDTEVYNITVINEADVNEEFQIQIRSIIPPGWTDPRIEWVGVGDIEDPELRLNRTVRLDPHETIHLHLERPIPDNSTPGELALDRLRFQSNFRPDHEAGTEVILRTTTDRSPGFTARFDPERTTTLPGETITPTLRLESEANAPQEITLKPVAPHGLGWEYRNDENERPPWRLELKPGETREFPVRIQVPFTAPPHTREETRLVLQATTPGVATPLVTTADLEIAEHEAATVETRSLVANPGRWMENPILVTNEGNLPTSVTARWDDDDLPEGWQIESAVRTVDVGDSRSSTIRIFAPNGATEEVRELPLEWVSDTGGVLAAGEWEVHVGIPSFQLRVEQVHASGSSLVVHVWILNDGRVPVYNVNVQLMDGDTVLDRVPLQQILPGKESVAPLVAPWDARNLAVRVTADHEPLGVYVDPSEAIARFEQQEAEQATLPAAAPILVVALVAALLSMRSSRNGRWRP